MNISWASFIVEVKNDGYHNLEGRLAILERASALFEAHGSFAAMSQYERKAISGTYGDKEPQLDNLKWAWFGTMFGQGDFKNLVNESPEYLSKALQNIPLDGDVSKAQFDAFVRGFNSAFNGKAHKGGVATATRLLAMRRPDVFVGLNNANRAGISKAFGTAPTTLSLGNYWACHYPHAEQSLVAALQAKGRLGWARLGQPCRTYGQHLLRPEQERDGQRLILHSWLRIPEKLIT